MWWNKPLLPKEPIVLRGDWVAELLAFMYTSSEVSGIVDETQVRSQTIVKTLFASLRLYSKTPEIESLCTRRTRTDHCRQGNLQTISPRLTCLPVTIECLEKGVTERIKEEAQTAFFERRPRIQSKAMKDIGSDPSAQLRWTRIEEAAQRNETMGIQSCSVHHLPDENICCHFSSQQLLAEHSRNWPSDELLREVDGLVVGMVLWLANFLYGGIHVAAWNDDFPSVAEQWLWRSSALYIAFCGGLWVVLNFIVSRNRRLNNFWERWMDGEKSWIHNLAFGTLVVLCGSSLMLARGYIVIKAFASIRSLPAAASQTPSWTQIFPHF